MFKKTNPNRPKYTVIEALKLLELNRHASIDDIRRQFKYLARQHHPDLSHIADKQLAHAKFIQINEAYSILTKNHENSKSLLVNKFVKNIRNFNKEKVTKLTKAESQNFIKTQFINTIEASEGIKFNINPSIISCSYQKGIFIIKPSSFRSIVYIIRKAYIKKYGTNRYNIFYNQYTHRLESFVKYYKQVNNVLLTVLYSDLLSQWEKINLSALNFDFSSTFSFKNLSSKIRDRKKRKSWKDNIQFNRSNRTNENKFLPIGIFRFEFIRKVSKKATKKAANIFNVLHVSSSLAKLFVHKNNLINRFKRFK